MKKLIFLTYSVLIFVVASVGVSSEPIGWKSVLLVEGMSDAQTEVYEVTNINNEKRYIQRSKTQHYQHTMHKPRSGEERFFVKLFMNSRSLKIGQPTEYFSRSNSFTNSCGANAGFDVLNWYGILHQSNPELTVEDLMDRMSTNKAKAKIAGVKVMTVPGTMPNGYGNAMRPIFKTHAPDYSFVYEHSSNFNRSFVETMLRNGHPITVAFKTGTKNSHIANIVGLEWVVDDARYRKNGKDFHILDNDFVYLTNTQGHTDSIDRMTWGDLKKRMGFRFYGAVGTAVVRDFGGKRNMQWFAAPLNLINSARPSGGPGKKSDVLYWQY